MTLAEVREELAEAIRYVRSDRAEAERLMRRPAAEFYRRNTGDPAPYGPSFWWRLEMTVRAAAEALVVDPDAAAGGLALVRHELALAVGRPAE